MTSRSRLITAAAVSSRPAGRIWTGSWSGLKRDRRRQSLSHRRLRRDEAGVLVARTGGGIHRERYGNQNDQYQSEAQKALSIARTHSPEFKRIDLHCLSGAYCDGGILAAKIPNDSKRLSKLDAGPTTFGTRCYAVRGRLQGRVTIE